MSILGFLLEYPQDVAIAVRQKCSRPFRESMDSDQIPAIHAILEMLSRRHARIFCEDGVVYLADLDSRNGTTVNRTAVTQAPCRLLDGDEVCFGGVLFFSSSL